MNATVSSFLLPKCMLQISFKQEDRNWRKVYIWYIHIWSYSCLDQFQNLNQFPTLIWWIQWWFHINPTTSLILEIVLENVGHPHRWTDVCTDEQIEEREKQRKNLKPPEYGGIINVREQIEQRNKKYMMQLRNYSMAIDEKVNKIHNKILSTWGLCSKYWV